MTLDMFHRDGRVEDCWLCLDLREFELFWRLAAQPGTRFTHRQLLVDVWSIAFEAQTNSWRVSHWARLRAKARTLRSGPDDHSAIRRAAMSCTRLRAREVSAWRVRSRRDCVRALDLTPAFGQSDAACDLGVFGQGNRSSPCQTLPSMTTNDRVANRAGRRAASPKCALPALTR